VFISSFSSVIDASDPWLEIVAKLVGGTEGEKEFPYDLAELIAGRAAGRDRPPYRAVDLGAVPAQFHRRVMLTTIAAQIGKPQPPGRAASAMT
jgi:hypothetical protein